MMDELIRSLLSDKVNECIRNQRYWVQLPDEQQQVLDETLDEIHNIATSIDKINSNERKVLPKYIAQFREAMILKMATELGMMNGGKRQ